MFVGFLREIGKLCASIYFSLQNKSELNIKFNLFVNLDRRMFKEAKGTPMD